MNSVAVIVLSYSFIKYLYLQHSNRHRPNNVIIAHIHTHNIIYIYIFIIPAIIICEQQNKSNVSNDDETCATAVAAVGRWGHRSLRHYFRILLSYARIAQHHGGPHVRLGPWSNGVTVFVVATVCFSKWTRCSSSRYKTWAYHKITDKRRWTNYSQFTGADKTKDQEEMIKSRFIWLFIQ